MLFSLRFASGDGHQEPFHNRVWLVLLNASRSGS